MKILAKLSVISLALTLAACGDGPSSSDIKDTATKLINQRVNSMPKAMELSLEIDDVDNVACEASGENYVCTYDVTTTGSSFVQKTPKTETKTTTASFSERDGDWVFVQ